MGTNTDEWYRSKAQRVLHKDGEIEIDDNATVSNGCDHGAYVHAWVWVDDDKEEE
jgi:hypothetical protein